MPGLPAALRRLVLPLILAAPPALAQDAPPAVDPVAAAILQSAASHIAAQDRIAVSWFTSLDHVVDGREKLTRTRSGNALLSRGEGFFAHTDNGSERREYYYDGGSFHVRNLDENAYAGVLHNGTFETLIDRMRAEYGVVLPVWAVLSNRSKAELVTKATSVAYVGETRIAGRPVHHIALSNYDADWQAWVTTDAAAPELVMLVGTNPYAQGWPQYRIYFTDWDFSPEVAPGSFTYVPDEDAVRMSWPKVPPQDTGARINQGASQ